MKIIAHRGNDNIHRENTLESIINSINSKYTDGVEFDIRITKDFKFIVNHDPFYGNYFINKTSCKTLQKQGLNTLEEILYNIKNDKILLIEIKEERNKYHILVAKLYRILKKYNLNYYVCSFNYDLVKYFKKKHPDIKVGLLIGIKMNTKYINNNLDFNSINIKHLYKVNNKETFIWTVNEKIKNIDNLNIITDKYKDMYDLYKNEKN